MNETEKIDPSPTGLETKLERLRDHLASLRPLLLAYSGGVDSSLLAAVAQEVLDEDFLAVTGISPSLSSHQLAQARRVARTLRFPFETLDTRELEDPRYAANPSDRCYFCKNELFGRLRSHYGDRFPWIVDGSNADDLRQRRPGRRAADEKGVCSPLAEAGLTKAEIRLLSRRFGLETADYPASPCLASRLPYGVEVTESSLAAVERGEEILRRFGFREFRLRRFADRGRVEVAGEELPRLEDRAFQARLAAELRTAAAVDQIEFDERPLRSGRLDAESR